MVKEMFERVGEGDLVERVEEGGCLKGWKKGDV